MDVSLIATGIAIGIGVNAPIGPANLMCIHRAIHNGAMSAMAAGAGAFVADLLRQGDIGVELCRDPSVRIVVGVFAMRPVSR